MLRTSTMIATGGQGANSRYVATSNAIHEAAAAAAARVTAAAATDTATATEGADRRESRV